MNIDNYGSRRIDSGVSSLRNLKVRQELKNKSKAQPQQPSDATSNTYGNSATNFYQSIQKSLQTSIEPHSQQSKHRNNEQLPGILSGVNLQKDQVNRYQSVDNIAPKNDIAFHSFKKKDHYIPSTGSRELRNMTNSIRASQQNSLQSLLVQGSKNDLKELKAKLGASNSNKKARMRILQLASQNRSKQQSKRAYLMSPTPVQESLGVHSSYYRKFDQNKEEAASALSVKFGSPSLQTLNRSAMGSAGTQRRGSPENQTGRPSVKVSYGRGVSQKGDIIHGDVTLKGKSKSVEGFIKPHVTDQNQIDKKLMKMINRDKDVLNDGLFDTKQARYLYHIIQKKVEKLSQRPYRKDVPLDPVQLFKMQQLADPTEDTANSDKQSHRPYQNLPPNIQEMLQPGKIADNTPQVYPKKDNHFNEDDQRLHTVHIENSNQNSNFKKPARKQSMIALTKIPLQEPSQKQSQNSLEDSQITDQKRMMQVAKTKSAANGGNTDAKPTSSSVTKEGKTPHSVPRFGTWSPSRRKFLKPKTKIESFDSNKIDVQALEDEFRDDFFFLLDDKDKPKVFLLLKSLKWDVERRITRAKMIERKEVHFPGFQEKFSETMDQYMEYLTTDYRKKNLMKELAAIGLDFNSGNHDLRRIVLMYSEEKFHEEINQLLNKLELVDSIGPLAIMLEEKFQQLFSREGNEKALVDYIKYLIGQQQNAQFKLDRYDFEQTHELNTKSLKLPFDEYALEEENAMKSVANNIIQKVDYNLVVHHFSDPASIMKQKDNPKYAYFRICKLDQELALPLLARIVNKQLCLQNYLLSIGHMKALVRTFDFSSEYINKFLIDNCGLTDQHNEILFSQFSKLDQVRELVLKRSEIGPLALNALVPTLNRDPPNALTCLRLFNCKISAPYTKRLVSALREKNSLQTLALVNAHITDSVMVDLGILVKESTTLKDLDISWNVVKPKSYVILLSALAENRIIRNVNISWNRLIEEEHQKAKKPEPQPVKSQKKAKANPIPEEPLEWHDQKPNYDKQEKLVIESIIELIKRNKQLQHLNLTATGLLEPMIVEIAVAMRRCRSLLSIHLCGNKGVTERSCEFMRTRIHAMPDPVKQTFKVNEILDRFSDLKEAQILKMQLSRGGEDEGEQPVARETIKLKQIFDRKRIYSKEHDMGKDSSDKSRLICTRVIGHKLDMPGIGQWQVITDQKRSCWICDQQIYGMIFWDPKYIAGKCYLNTAVAKQAKLMHQIVDELHSQVCSKEEEDEIASKNPDSPLIYGDFTNWKPKPMTEITKFSDLFMPQFDQDQILERLKSKKLVSEDAKLGQLSPRSKYEFQSASEDYWYRIATVDWKTVVSQHMHYKKPHLANAANTRKDFYGNLFVHPALFEVNKHDYIVRSPGPNPHYMFKSTISDVRPEDPPQYFKPKVHRTIMRVFNKDNSVFAPWKEDNQRTLERMGTTDFADWKIDRVVKDERDYNNVMKLLRENLPYLKEIFLELAVNSSYPFISVLEMSTFCQTCDLFDSVFKISHNDLLFISTNAQKKGNIVQKSGLIRCEFFEFLVRVCDFKLIQTGQYKTYTEALRYLINNKIKPSLTPQPWQEFRENELWCLEVNDLLEANLTNMQKIYKFYQNPDHQFMSLKDCINLMMRDTGLQLTEKQAKYCYGFSKMSNMDESNDFQKTNRIAFVELLEMMGRVAHVKFEGTEFETDPLYMRIEKVLDMILPLVGAKRKEVVAKVDSDSESDADY